ncbi:hypothetical protein [Sphingomonas sp.]|uniref:hypothetical protein n=1 Tax=Sphingomonas sp. TaxID=28214 RepID=UPI002DD660EB|nr:hypothetical protein [Sphingomonas sp.]
MALTKLTARDLTADLLAELHARFEELARAVLDDTLAPPLAHCALALNDRVQPLSSLVHEVVQLRAELRVIDGYAAACPDEFAALADAERPALLDRLGAAEALLVTALNLHGL